MTRPFRTKQTVGCLFSSFMSSLKKKWRKEKEAIENGSWNAATVRIPLATMLDNVS